MFVNKQILLITLLILLWSGQSVFSQEKPFWTDGYFYDAKNSYIEVVTATGWEIANAKQKAYQEIINRRSLATGTEANVNIENLQVTAVGNKDLITTARIIDEYNEYVGGGVYKSYLLVQTAKNPTYQLEPVSITNKYPFSARVFVPGCAQIYKGSYAKGTSMIASEAVFAIGIAVSEGLRQNYLKNSENNEYASKVNTCEIIRDISIGGLVGVYLWSLIDGIVAPGKPHIVIGNISASITPHASITDVGAVIAMRF